MNQTEFRLVHKQEEICEETWIKFTGCKILEGRKWEEGSLIYYARDTSFFSRNNESFSYIEEIPDERADTNVGMEPTRLSDIIWYPRTITITRR